MQHSCWGRGCGFGRGIKVLCQISLCSLTRHIYVHLQCICIFKFSACTQHNIPFSAIMVVSLCLPCRFFIIVEYYFSLLSASSCSPSLILVFSSYICLISAHVLFLVHDRRYSRAVQTIEASLFHSSVVRARVRRRQGGPKSQSFKIHIRKLVFKEQFQADFRHKNRCAFTCIN